MTMYIITPEQQTAVKDLSTPAIIEDLFFTLWENWWGALLALGTAGNIPGKMIAERAGCTPTAPYALMFSAFCLGVEAGIAAADAGPSE